MRGRESGDLWVAKPPATVWRGISTATDVPTWYDDWDYGEAVDQSSELLMTGTVFHLYKKGTPQPYSVRCFVVMADIPKRLCWVETHPDQPPVFVEFELAPDRNGTRITHTKTVGKLRFEHRS